MNKRMSSSMFSLSDGMKLEQIKVAQNNAKVI